jgi:hypothetical protein
MCLARVDRVAAQHVQPLLLPRAAFAVAMQLLLQWELAWAIDVCVLLLPAASKGECFFGLLAAAAAATGRPRQDSSPQHTAPQCVLCVMLPRLCCVLPLSSNFSHTCLSALCSMVTALGATCIQSMSPFFASRLRCVAGCVHLLHWADTAVPCLAHTRSAAHFNFGWGERGAPRVAQTDPPVGAEPTGSMAGKKCQAK